MSRDLRPNLAITLLAALLLLAAPKLLAQEIDEDKIGEFKGLGSGSRYALLIGISEYEFKDEFVALPYSRQEAEVLGKALDDAGFTTAVMTCKAPGKARAERSFILEKVQYLVKVARPEDSILIYFSGHGVGDEQGRNYFIACNTKPNTPDDLSARTRTAIPLDDLKELLDKSRAKRKVVWIDACREVVVMGAKRKLGRAFADPIMKADAKPVAPTAIVFSTQPGTFVQPRPAQLTIGGEAITTGLFAHFLLKGLGGAAEANGDGVLSFVELARYVGKGFEEKGFKDGFEQVPHVLWSGTKVDDIPLRVLPKTGTVLLPGGEPKKDGPKEDPEVRRGQPTPAPPASAGAITRTEPDHRRILADRLLWRKAREQEQDAAVTWIGTKLGSAYKHSRTETYSCGGQSQRIASFIHGKTRIELNLIPGGAFQMGSSEYDTEKPLHQAKIPAMLVAVTELTQAQWDAIGGADARVRRGAALPIETVSWADAQAWLKKASDGLRLPSEAEWEYACRAGSTTRFAFGDSDEGLSDYAWYEKTSEGEMHPVGQKKANAFGLYDMHGNVWELCQDDYIGDYRSGPNDHLARGDGTAGARVSRGGGWGGSARCCQSAYRFGGAPTDRDGHLGLRPVRALP